LALKLYREASDGVISSVPLASPETKRP